jgi:predicted GIY-YIG superfamily endonuclease
MRAQNYFVYVLTNGDRHTILYIGVTNDLEHQASDHSLGVAARSRRNTTEINSFILKRFPIHRALLPEKSSPRNWSRAKKEALITRGNPEWQDLFEEMYALKST